MTHRFPVKEIAAQAGLSTATVDRVLNGRAHVSPQSRARVASALAELEGQEVRLAARGRRVFVDVVVEAPDRFSREIRAAAEAVLPGIRAAVLRPRFEMHERMSGAAMAAVLRRIARRGSQGVCLKARDLPEVREAVAEVVARGIPVVTLVTDLPGTARLAYAGLDNRAAGRTAAWLIAAMVRGPGGVLTSVSDSGFLGEEARFAAFVTELALRAPDLAVRAVQGGGGLNAETGQRIAKGLAGALPVRAVYSMGGGNRAIVAALAAAGVRPDVFVAHDLDADNRALLARGDVTVVLDHDLSADMAQAFGHLLAAGGLGPVPPGGPSPVRIVTPVNLPP